MITCSIIIVNYRSAQLLIDCLRTILPDNTLEVIVVDNCSGDDSEQAICTAFPQVSWLQMGYNSGFARANNAGIRVAKGEAVLLLNPDTLNQNNAIDLCVKRFLPDDYIACGVQLLNPDGSPQISGSYVMKGGLNHLLPLPYVGRVLKFLGGLLKVKKTSLFKASGVIEVDWINGAFLMVKRAVLERTGLMDEDFFLYAEEAEWCSRLRKAGKLCIYGEYHVIHLQGATANETFNSSGQGYMNLFDKKGFQLLVSNTLRVRKEFGIKWFFVHLFFLTATIPVFFACLLMAKIFTLGNSFYSWRQFSGYFRNVLGLIKYAGKIVRNKPYFYKVL